LFIPIKTILVITKVKRFNMKEPLINRM